MNIWSTTVKRNTGPCVSHVFSGYSAGSHIQGMELDRKSIVGFLPPLAAGLGGQRCGGIDRLGWGWRWICSKDRKSPPVTCSISGPALLWSTRDTKDRAHLHSFKSTEQEKPAGGHLEVALALRPLTKPCSSPTPFKCFIPPKAVSTIHKAFCFLNYWGLKSGTGN